MKVSELKEADIQFQPEPKLETINPIENTADGVAILNDGILKSGGYVPGIQGWGLKDDGTAEFRKLVIASKTVAVSPGQSIQAALDELANEGGGIIQLGAGTYSVSSNITFPVKAPIQIIGENMSSTIISFGGNYRMILAGTGIYTTGTVTISSGVTVTGSSTNWLSSGLVAGDQIFLDSRWYKIAAITDNTTIILAEGYGGSALAGGSYRAGKLVQDVEIKEVSITGSTSTSGALDVDDARNIVLEDVTFYSNNKGFVVTNFSEWVTDRLIVVTSTGDGATFSTGNFCNNRQISTIANGGHGCVLTSVKTGSFEFSSSQSNTTDGYNITSCTDIVMKVQASGNGGQGIEAVSGNDNLLISDGLISGNTSDGIKLTATTDNCRISTCKITGNGGYGVNIAASTCDNNIVVTSVFASNSSGNLNDSGTDTVRRANVGVSDISYNYLTGSTTLQFADTERSGSDSSYALKKEIDISGYGKGTVNVSFDLKHSSGAVSSFGRIYVNEVAVGTERSTNSTSYQTYTEDIVVAPNDRVELYAYCTSGTGNYFVRNFRLRTSVGKETTSTITD